jgi:hypothetical protein
MFSLQIAGVIRSRGFSWGSRKMRDPLIASCLDLRQGRVERLDAYLEAVEQRCSGWATGVGSVE